MSWHEIYSSKLVSAEEAVKVVKSGDWVDYGLGHTKPYALDFALADRRDSFEDLYIRHALSFGPQACAESDPAGDVFTFQSWHFTGYDRKLHDTGKCSYIPMVFRNMPIYYEKSLKDKVDVAMVRVTGMNKDGYFNLHCGVAATRAMLDAAKIIILEVNENLPWAMGGTGETVHVSEARYIVEDSSSPVEVLPTAIASEEDKKIAGHIVPLIRNGSCLQLGIGGLPNTLGTMLADSDVRDLGCNTEMLVDAYYVLSQAGKLTNRHKQVERGKSTWTFAAGSRALYDWLDFNPSLAVYPVSFTNNPFIMSRNQNVVSINACMEVDMYGQVSSESSGTRHISGTGGQLDFVRGAYMSEGGASYICCNSTYRDRDGVVRSRIVPVFSPGTVVTVPRTQVHCIVTEYGIADLAGKPTWMRAQELVMIAHPDFREGLIRAAENMKIWRRSNKRV